MSDFEISTDPNRLDVDVIYSFLSTSYWSAGIPREVVEKSINNSLCFGVYSPEGQQVGFARMITDKATFAYLADVFILEDFRGMGLSKRLMEFIFSYPELQGLRRMMLATRDAHSLYEKYGFTPLTNPDTFMQNWNPEVYSKSKA